MKSVSLFFIFCCSLIALSPVSARPALRSIDYAHGLTATDLLVLQPDLPMDSFLKKRSLLPSIDRFIDQAESIDNMGTCSGNSGVLATTSQTTALNSEQAPDRQIHLPTVCQGAQVKYANFPTTQLGETPSGSCEGSNATLSEPFESSGRAIQNLSRYLAFAQQPVLVPEKNTRSIPPEYGLASSSER